MSNPMIPPSLPGYPAPAAAAPYPAYSQPAPVAAPQGYPGPAVAAPAPQPAPGLPPLPQGWEYGPGNVPRPVQLAAPAPAPAPVHAAPPAPPPAYAPQAAPAPAPGANPFFGIKLPGERHPDVALGEHVLDVEKIRLTEDRTALIVSFRYAASSTQRVGDVCSSYVNLYGYRTQQYSGELAKLLLAAVGFNTYEELQASGQVEAFTQIATLVVQGTETALSGRRIACQGYNHTPRKGDNAGKTFVKAAFAAYRQAA